MHIWSNYLKWLTKWFNCPLSWKITSIIIWCDGIIKFCWSTCKIWYGVWGTKSPRSKVSIQAAFVSFIIPKIYQWFVLLSVKKIDHRLGGAWSPPGSATAMKAVMGTKQYLLGGNRDDFLSPCIYLNVSVKGCSVFACVTWRRGHARLACVWVCVCGSNVNLQQ